MLSLHRVIDGDLSAGDALPGVYSTFEKHDIRFYRSALHMTAGRPGGGKSILALDHALKCKVPSLYLSCDMSRFQFAARAAAILTGDSAGSVKEIIKTAQGREKYRAALKGADHLYMAFEKRPDQDCLEDILLAFEERWGIPPELIVVDNAINLVPPTAKDEWSGLREISHLLEWFADELGSAVHLLHHTNLPGLKLDRPGPLNSIKGQIVEGASLILSVTKTDDEFRVTAVKNRNGPEDPTAQQFLTLSLSGALSLSDPPPTPVLPAQFHDWA
ncbi:AAA family ATPase [Streptosporangium sp. NPDC020072]|uniref:AAA family ATPase n=1 Tax=Streptosporangium sp. NPDC020072 TaxID=3154788 RepID=UPI0034195D8A